MAAHAHPDDESSSTGGVLARYSDERAYTTHSRGLTNTELARAAFMARLSTR